MNDKRKKIFTLDIYVFENIISTLMIAMITLMLGLNMLRTYNNYIVVQHSDSDAILKLRNPDSSSETITLSINDNRQYPMLELYVNGTFILKFDNNKEITIKVNTMDVIQINGAMYNEDISLSIKYNDTGYLDSNRVVIDSKMITLDTIRM